MEINREKNKELRGCFQLMLEGGAHERMSTTADTEAISIVSLSLLLSSDVEFILADSMHRSERLLDLQ